jgi:hypothetical protein
VMRLHLCLVVVVALFLTGQRVCVAQAPATPAADSAHAQHRPQGFFDYALGKVNPTGEDYGATMREGRTALVEHTVDDLYFWSNAVGLFMLIIACAQLLLQWRAAEKKEIVAASLIAQLWNGRVCDKIEIERRTEQYNQLVETHNAEIEKALMRKQQPSDQDRDATTKLSKSVRKLSEKDETTTDRQLQADSDGSPRVTASDPGTNPTNLQQQNILLQRRVEAMQNSEQNLKQRLNQTTALLDQERRRNSALKGA